MGKIRGGKLDFLSWGGLLRTKRGGKKEGRKSMEDLKEKHKISKCACNQGWVLGEVSDGIFRWMTFAFY